MSYRRVGGGMWPAKDFLVILGMNLALVVISFRAGRYWPRKGGDEREPFDARVAEGWWYLDSRGEWHWWNGSAWDEPPKWQLEESPGDVREM